MILTMTRFWGLLKNLHRLIIRYFSLKIPGLLCYLDFSRLRRGQHVYI